MKWTLLAAAMLAAASPLAAKTADTAITLAVAAPDRPADMVKLDASRKPVAVLEFEKLKPGDHVLDVMGGQGYYSEIIAAAVGPKGSVVVLEPSAYMDDAKVKAGWDDLIKRHPNVSLQVAPPANATLGANSFDFVLFHLTYHDTYWSSEKYKYPKMDPAAFLAKLYTAVKPGGIVAVIDHVGPTGVDPRVEADKTHRIDPAVIKADFAKAGFKLEAESQLLAVPGDDHTKLVFDPAVRGNTDRVVYRFRKPL